MAKTIKYYESERGWKAVNELGLSAVPIAGLDVLLGFMRQFYAIDGYAFEEATTPRVMCELLNNDNDMFGLAWLIERDGCDIGYIVGCFGHSLEVGGPCTDIDETFIAETHRGLGIGSCAKEFAIDGCRRRGIHIVFLNVERHNARAMGVFQKLASRPVNARR